MVVGNNLLWIDDRRQCIEARIGHGHHTDIGLDGAERIVFRLNARLGECIEKCGLTYIRQAHDAAFKSHNVFVPSCCALVTV